MSEKQTWSSQHGPVTFHQMSAHVLQTREYATIQLRCIQRPGIRVGRPLLCLLRLKQRHRPQRTPALTHIHTHIPSMTDCRLNGRVRCFCLCSLTNAERETESERDRRRIALEKIWCFPFFRLGSETPSLFHCPFHCHSTLLCGADEAPPLTPKRSSGWYPTPIDGLVTSFP